jgi:hypothetical protein
MDFSLDPQAPEPDDPQMGLRTRSGYIVSDAVRSFKIALEQSGAVAAGKSIHYTADLVCSGCFELWMKLLYEYALDHIGIASPRIFHFLSGRFQDLVAAWAKLPAEQFYKTLDYQKAMAECVLVLRSCPRRPAPKMPRVPAEAHHDEWVRGATSGAPSAAAVAKVWRGTHDLAVVRRVGDEFAKAIADGATEKAMFWLKWLLEEDNRLKKENKGALSTMDRGPSQWPQKSRNGIGFFIAALLTEIYKELAAKSAIRMTEEFQTLLRLYSLPSKLMTQRRRLDLLCLCIQIVSEVPRWKIPAAPALVKDPVALGRATAHAETFFREVLAYEAPTGDLQKEAKKSAGKQTTGLKVKDAKKLKQMTVDDQIAANNALIDQFLTGKL